MDYLRLALAVACILATGYLILTLVLRKFKRDYPFSTLEKIGLSFGMGCGAISLEMFLISLVGIRLDPFVIMLPWIAMASFLLYKKRHDVKKLIRGPKERERKSRKFQKMNFIEIILIAFMVFFCAYGLLYAVNVPLEEWDSWLIWGYKAKIFFVEKGIPLTYFNDGSKSFTHFDYPLLIPLSETFIYLWLNKINDALVNVLSPLFYISLLVVFYSILRRGSSRLHALWFTFILSSVPFMLVHSTLGYADLPLAFYTLVAISYIFIWLKEGNSFCIYIAAIFTALAAWTKNEGALSFVILFFIVIHHLFSDYKIGLRFEERLKPILSYTLISLVFIGPWFVFKSALGIESEYLSNVKLIFRVDFMERLIVISKYLYREIFSIHNWNVLYLFLIVFTARFAKRSFSKPLSYLLIFIFLQLTGYVAIHIITPKDLIFSLDRSLSRLILHITPVVVFLISNQISGVIRP